MVYKYPRASQKTPRPVFQFIKNNLKRTGLVGAEIGVEAGINALSILNTLGIEKLYLVDPWCGEYERHYDIVRDGLEQDKRFELIRTTSRKAAQIITEPLDFCYIDANHKYHAVREDIKLWYPKVKNGGVLGGHDYIMYDKVGKITKCGVVEAVTEFISENRFHLHIGYIDRCGDWWIVKGDEFLS